MKRLITAVSFAVFATPALADLGKPYEQLDVNRALPAVSVDAGTTGYRSGSAPYEQVNIDRSLPDLRGERSQVAAAFGDTRSDVEIATEVEDAGGWENDHHFVAPPQ